MAALQKELDELQSQIDDLNRKRKELLAKVDDETPVCRKEIKDITSKLLADFKNSIPKETTYLKSGLGMTDISVLNAAFSLTDIPGDAAFTPDYLPKKAK